MVSGENQCLGIHIGIVVHLRCDLQAGFISTGPAVAVFAIAQIAITIAPTLNNVIKDLRIAIVILASVAKTRTAAKNYKGSSKFI